MTPPVPTIPPSGGNSLLSEIFAAIFYGLQIASGALPLIKNYKDTFDPPTMAAEHPVISTITSAADQVHPVTGSIVRAALTPPERQTLQVSQLSQGPSPVASPAQVQEPAQS